MRAAMPQLRNFCLRHIFGQVTAAVLGVGVGVFAYSSMKNSNDLTPYTPETTPEPTLSSTATILPYANPITQLIAQTVYGRRFVAPDETNFNAIGKIYAGNSQFSGQAVKFTEYQTRSGILISTAAHGLVGQKIEDIDINFTVSYVDNNGNKQSYITLSSKPEVWINPSYQANYIEGEEPKVGPNDTALLFYPDEVLPEEIKPIEQYVFSYQIPEYNSYKIGTSQIRSAGYAADLGGSLSTDEDCKFDFFSEGETISTNCITNKGSSGSALLASSLFNRNYSLGVLSGVTTNGHGEVNIQDEAFRSVFAPFYHYQLEEIPFLKKEQICAAVIAPSGARLRDYATTDSDTNGATLPFNQTVMVTSMLFNEQAEIGAKNIWVRVQKTLDGRDGYIRADLLKENPCPPQLRVSLP